MKSVILVVVLLFVLSIPAVSQEGDAEPGGKWEVSAKINPMDDSKTVICTLIADEGKSSWGMSPWLMLRYRSGKTDVYIVWHDSLGSEAYVTCRIGKDKPQSRYWGLSTCRRATLYPGSLEDFIARLLTVEKLVVRAIPHSESPITAVFDVRGLREAAQPYNDIHGWF